MGTRPGPRPLPRSLDPIPGESLGGYLLRLSWRLRVSPLQLARLTGCAGGGPAVIRRRLLLDLDAQRFAQATRLSAGEASSLGIASWADRYPPIARSRLGPDPPIVLDGWLFSTSIRYCPGCLAGDGSPVQQQYGGPWKKIWHLPITFACVQHQRFLRERCPRPHSGSLADWRLIAYPSASDLHPLQCRLPLQAGKTGRHRASCGIRLDQSGEEELPCPAPETLAIQERLLTLLRPQHPAEDAVRTFADLRLICTLLNMSWPPGQDLIDPRLAPEVSEHARRIGSNFAQSLDRQPVSILATAALLTAAAAIRESDDLEDALVRTIRPRRYSPRQTMEAVVRRHQSACSPAMREAAMSLAARGSIATRRKRRTQ
jgi:TniQ